MKDQRNNINHRKHINHRSLVCLCPRCRQNFMAAGIYSLRRACPRQEIKETCTYCQTRYGYDYYVKKSVRTAAL